MTFSRVTRALFVITLCFAFLASAYASDFGKPEELVAKSTTVYRSFIADPHMTWFHHNVKNAKGIFIVPQMLRGGFILGGSGGSGVLLAQDSTTGKWSYPAFYTMGSVSLGFQIGAETSEIVLMIMTDRGLKAMLSTEFKLGADVTVAAGPIGGTAKAQTVDILAFGRSKGAFGGVSIEGAVIEPRIDWNQQYYKKTGNPADILIYQNVSNPDADPLLKTLPQQRFHAPAVQTLGS
ncbi:MAG: hypothetical protein CSA31_01185 [Desulfobulbus propionicus]|nr:MAG: hypothetical protein CSB34_06315 [Desulfobulbus propionicus]PIE60611.1 MAG: hypothetical protein CSA31_01185 [Desulfobulbus propionicus]